MCDQNEPCQSRDESSDAFANAGRSVLGDEANVGGPEFQTSDEVEGGRDQRGHALLADRPPEWHKLAEGLLNHDDLPWAEEPRRGSGTERRGNEGSARGRRR